MGPISSPRGSGLVDGRHRGTKPPRTKHQKGTVSVQSGSLSVVVPTYNVAAYLPEFMSSLDAQTGDVSAVEIIFVNDGSTDESESLSKEWLGRRATAMTTRLSSKPNGGLSSAGNAGLDIATGEWVTFCDPDDVLTPDYLGI